MCARRQPLRTGPYGSDFSGARNPRPSRWALCSFEKLLLTPRKPAASARDWPCRKHWGLPSTRLAYLTTDTEREGECQPCNIPSVYLDVFQQVTARGSFGREQREDDRLRNCWEQVRRVDEVNRLPGPHPLPNFEIRGRKNSSWLCLKPRRKLSWSWHMPIRWRDTLGWKTPFNASWTISTGQGWMQKSNGSAVFALPASRRLLVVLPQALSFRCPSLMCPSSRSGWIWWDRCQSLPGVMSTSWSFWTTPPSTRKPSPFVQQMQKTLPESCFCWPAELGYQRKSWLTRVHNSCPGWWQTSVDSSKYNN